MHGTCALPRLSVSNKGELLRLTMNHNFLLGCDPITEFRSCVKVEVAVLGSQSLTVLMASVDVQQH